MANQNKKSPSDFIFGKLIGEGSFSNVFLAKEISTNLEFAIKVLEKYQILRERKQQYVQREKDVLLKLNHPFFIRLYFTFQDADRLYFGLSYARNGELLTYIDRLKCFDENCTRFYSAEIIVALEYLHSLNIIHRDLKPENILLNELMHIQITDFGSAKILDAPQLNETNELKRKNSFVGTAQYVSPEVLNSSQSHYSSDLWALGCIIYQLLTGNFPFHGSHEYDIFQKILKLDYRFPDGFNTNAKDLLEKLLVLDPKKRLGCEEMGGYAHLKKHIFFKTTIWDDLDKQTPPELTPHSTTSTKTLPDLWNNCKPGLNEVQLSQLLNQDLTMDDNAVCNSQNNKNNDSICWSTSDNRAERLEDQSRNNEYHKFVENNIIIKQGFLEKRKGLFPRKRMFLLTEGPRLFYVDPASMVLKGEVPWTKELRPEAKNFKIFYIHTPNRIYYLEDLEGNALKWCDKLNEVMQYYFPSKT